MNELLLPASQWLVFTYKLSSQCGITPKWKVSTCIFSFSWKGKQSHERAPLLNKGSLQTPNSLTAVPLHGRFQAFFLAFIAQSSHQRSGEEVGGEAQTITCRNQSASALHFYSSPAPPRITLVAFSQPTAVKVDTSRRYFPAAVTAPKEQVFVS